MAAVGIAIVNDFKSVEGGVDGLREEKDPPKWHFPKWIFKAKVSSKSADLPAMMLEMKPS